VTAITLSVRGLGKAFRSYRSEWHRFARWFGIPVVALEEFRALHQVSFDLFTGEALGIIGQNGAGKSTLLKLVTGTLQATEGAMQIDGRVAAILELGMGFYPDLTGRQNVERAAGLMGFSSADIAAAMPEIEAFAEIGEHFDDPVRNLSSGMQVRVAFAVATAWRPDVLIVDEALSVGDAYFQHKSFARIREFQEAGTSLLLVSHDRGAVQALCERTLLLEEGRVIRDGPTDEVFDFYNALIAEKEAGRITVTRDDSGRAQTASGSGEATVCAVRLLNEAGEDTEFLKVGELACLQVEIEVREAVDDLVLGYMFKDRLGQVVYGTNTRHLGVQELPRQGGARCTLAFRFVNRLGVGSYSLSTALHSGTTHLEQNYEWRDQQLTFTVANADVDTFVGVNWMPPNVELHVG
jgi:lipopolysaccharide transport system ATP-binding protein